MIPKQIDVQKKEKIFWFLRVGINDKKAETVKE